MTLDELKSDWQQSVAPKSEVELQQMISQKASSVFYRTKLKVIVESIALVVFPVVFLTGLDAERNEAWVNFLVILTAAVGITNNLWLYYGISANRLNTNLKESLLKVKRKLQGQILLAVIFSSLLNGSVFLFFFFRIPFTLEKIGLLVLLLVVGVFIRTGAEVWRWQKNSQRIDQCLSALTY
ncbi:MAG: hypothetical protein AAF944_28770 [Bacteroidota bacterium]